MEAGASVEGLKVDGNRVMDSCTNALVPQMILERSSARSPHNVQVVDMSRAWRFDGRNDVRPRK